MAVDDVIHQPLKCHVEHVCGVGYVVVLDEVPVPWVWVEDDTVVLDEADLAIRRVPPVRSSDRDENWEPEL